jgi:hypothetical protein
MKKFCSPAWAALASEKGLDKLASDSLYPLNLFYIASGYSSLIEYSAGLFCNIGAALPLARSFLLGTTLNMLSFIWGSTLKSVTSISLLAALFVFTFDNLSVFSN